MKKPVKKLAKAQDGIVSKSKKVTLNANKMSKGVREGIKFLQEGKEEDYQKFGANYNKLSKEQKDSVVKYQKANLIYGKKRGGAVKSKKK